MNPVNSTYGGIPKRSLTLNGPLDLNNMLKLTVDT